MVMEDHPEPLLDTLSYPFWIAFLDLSHDRINNGRVSYSSKSLWMSDHSVEDKDLFLEIIGWIDTKFMEVTNRENERRSKQSKGT
jgi:hypothetical protein